MLTVCRARRPRPPSAARGATPTVRSRDVLTTSAAAAREALARTPDQLQVLRDAGVVDAGGRGVVVILDAAETALTGKRPAAVEAGRTGSRSRSLPSRAATWWTAGRRTR